MRVKVCSTRARTLRCEALCSSFPGRQFGLAAFAAVRDDQAGAPVAAVRDHGRPADGGLRAGQLPRIAVIAIARDRTADRDDEPGVGVDHDLVVGGVPVVLRLLRDSVVAGGHQSAVHDQYLFPNRGLGERRQGGETAACRAAT